MNTNRKNNNISLGYSEDTQNRETAKQVYERLKTDRQNYTDRAEKCAQFTIPALFPKETDNSSSTYKIPHQSFGARGVNNLSSKLLLALFPPNSTFFRLDMNPVLKSQVSQQDPAMQQEIEAAMMKMEQRILKYVETSQIRVTIKEALNQLIVAGNCLLYLPPKEGGAKLYRLSSYVVQRDALGKVLQIVTVDKLLYGTLPDDVKNLLTQNGKQWKVTDPVEIYTHAYLMGDRYYSYQEIEGNPIQGTEQQFPMDKSPWIALRFVKMDGESYGRSFVEEYLGDLENLDGLQEAILNYAAIAAHILYLVNPGGITQARRIAKAKTGDFVPGRKEDINVLQLDKSTDIMIAKSTVDAIEQRLSYCFILNSVVQRDAERVTAEEIRQVAGELEDTLGGTYSILSQELQLPLVKRIMAQLEANGEIPITQQGDIEPSITTGLEALGRGHDFNKLEMLQQSISALPGAEQYINVGAFIKAKATSLGIDTTGLIKTDEQIQQEQQQVMEQQMMANATGPAVNGLMGMAQAEQQANLQDPLNE
jgi:hypothetical protein|nr:MAG TPA: Head to tail joining protein [Caudoviricetes sp.]